MIIHENGLTFELDTKDFGAKIINSPKARGIVFIPRSINYEFNEFKIKSINKNSFKNNINIKSIEFPDDSEIQSIDSGAFADSSIESLSIPPNLTELKEGWCKNTPGLRNILISPKNKYFKLFDKKMIVGKTDINSEVYDILIFANRDIKDALIPSSIKYISPFSFSYCSQLETIKFSEQPKIEIIGEHSFSHSSLENIDIPKGITKIGSNSFMWCKNLRTINFSELSNLLAIEKGTFSHTSIRSLTIPSSVKVLENGWCYEMSRLSNVSLSSENKNFLFFGNEMIIGKSDPESDRFDVVVFACRDVERAVIPSYVKSIGSFSFSYSSCLETIEFSEDSELLSICEGAFSYSPIKNISIPQKVERLEDGWCRWTSELTNISISPKNKNFKLFDKKMIVGKSNINSEVYDILIFANRDIKEAIIPSSIKYISPFSFSYCSQLETIKFSEQPKIEIIGEYSFSCSSLENIDIPKGITKIGRNSFMWCKNLRTINFSEKSNLRTIEEEAFAYSSIEYISIPSSVTHIGNFLFLSCNDLHAIEFLGDGLSIEKFICKNLFIVSFPNAKKISVNGNYLHLFQFSCSFFFSAGAEVIH